MWKQVKESTQDSKHAEYLQRALAEHDEHLRRRRREQNDKQERRSVSTTEAQQRAETDSSTTTAVRMAPGETLYYSMQEFDDFYRDDGTTWAAQAHTERMVPVSDEDSVEVVEAVPSPASDAVRQDPSDKLYYTKQEFEEVYQEHTPHTKL